MTILWNALEQYLTVVMFIFQFSPVGNFGKFINFGHGRLRSKGLIPVQFLSYSFFTRLLYLCHQLFFQERNFLKRCKKQHCSFHEAAHAFMKILPESRTAEVKSFILNVDQQVDKMSEEVTLRQKHLQNVSTRWKTFDSSVDSLGKWMEKAEALIKNGTLKACKVRFMLWPSQKCL